MSWAALVKKTEPQAPSAPASEAAPLSNKVAVVDANVIISGLQLGYIADRFITTQDVLNEIRDKQARNYLAALPFSLEVQEPDEVALATVTAFARETGDLHALSRTDLKLLALAYSLEVAAHGDAHLRKHPVQATLRPKHKTGGRQLPGWGNVPNPKDWAAIDALPDSAGQGQSRIRASALPLDGEQSQQEGEAPVPATPAQDHTAPSGSGHAAPTPATDAQAGSSLPYASFGDAAAADLAAAGPQDTPAAAWFANGTTGPATATTRADAEAGAQSTPAVGLTGVSHFTAAPLLPGQTEPGASNGHVTHAGDDDESDSESEGEWEQAGKSRNAVRRRRRNQRRYEARQAAREAQAATAATAADTSAHHAPTQPQPNAATPAHPATPETVEAAPAKHSEDDDTGSVAEDGDVPLGHAYVEGEGEGEGTECGASVAQDSESVQASGTDCGELTVNTTSSVACVTADFAMQNVLLQMGLRLVTRDGKQISRLSRWAVRCSACFFVTKEVGKLFCPRCGNMTMDRVEVTVGPGGAEVYGVRKRHILRGTQFSLPKPKGGRAQNPILREDELLTKIKPGARKKAQQAQADLDPFAPEHGTQASLQHNDMLNREMLANTKGAAYLLAGHKHNPNERKPVTSNRRRK